MRIPDGRECKFFYGDYYRGRNFEECRALSSPEERKVWTSELCSGCPLPDYLRNNSCQHLVYSVFIRKFLFKKRIKVKAWCSKTHQSVSDPNIGCGHCHDIDNLS